MKKLILSFLYLGIIVSAPQSISAQQAQSQNWNAPANSNANTQNAPSLRVGIVNTKKCLEDSKLGKQEQVNFEKMKKQMENILQDKESALEDIEGKLNDDDYMDSISDEAASELKRKRKTIKQEGYQLQSQYMQTLQQANVKIVQKITEGISKASAQVAKESAFTSQPLDIVLSDEACTFFSPQLDVTDKVVAKMNAAFEVEQKDNQPKTR